MTISCPWQHANSHRKIKAKNIGLWGCHCFGGTSIGETVYSKAPIIRTEHWAVLAVHSMYCRTGISTDTYNRNFRVLLLPFYIVVFFTNSPPLLMYSLSWVTVFGSKANISNSSSFLEISCWVTGSNSCSNNISSLALIAITMVQIVNEMAPTNLTTIMSSSVLFVTP